jgi:hypothetical protein
MAEPHYERYTNNQLAEAIHIRRQAYQTFFAGGAGFTYGAHQDKPVKRGPLFSPFNRWKEMLDLEGAQALPILRDFLEEQAWHQWKPAPSFVVDNEGNGEKRIVAVAAETQKKLLVYFPENRRAKIQLPAQLENGSLQLSWFNPKNGTYTTSDKDVTAQSIRLKPPEECMDAVAIVEAQ